MSSTVNETCPPAGSPPRGLSEHSSSHILLSDLTPLLKYTSPLARFFTSEEILAGKSRLNQKAFVQASIEHPPNAIVEFPQTGSGQSMGIAHIFLVDLDAASFHNPRDNIQYSLGEPQGYRHRVKCHLLRDPETGDPVCCLQQKIACMFLILHFKFF